jgi:DUF1680 family protein
MKVANQISLNALKPGNGFIGKYQRLVKDVVIPYQHDVLCDQVEGAEKSHVLQNFINAGKALRGEENDGFYGMVFQDSDAAKWLEAVAYSLSIFPDPELEAIADQFIVIIAEAQDEDGYINTYYTIKDKEKRFQNLLEGHELYCSGHMMEAACAYYETTKKDKLLQVMLKNMEHIYHRFVTEGAPGYPGHPEIELALMKMYRVTGNNHCLELAEHFINVRGRNPHFYEEEAKKRDWKIWGNDPCNHEYQQSDKPLRELSDATGHAVRAVYLYTGMADVASETGDKELLLACERLWQSITERRMYLTGGIGSTVMGEAFSVDYDLPGDTAYAETCASIGLMFFASRMLEVEVDGKYTDVMEKAFYNTVLAGMQLDGKKFFYVNPLDVVPGISGKSPTHRHDLPVRPKWYACACCPPNVARLVSSIGKYAYAENEDTVFCHLFADGEISFQNGLQLCCETKYPYELQVAYHVLQGSKKIAIRIPGWSKAYSLKLNGALVNEKPVKGYVYVAVNAGDEISLQLDEKPYYVYGSTKVPRLTGSAAVCRGPLVYCFEGVDNEEDVLSLILKTNGNMEVLEYNEAKLGGTVDIAVETVRMVTENTLYSMEVPKEVSCKAIAVPYYTWGNRGENQMRVWLNRTLA